MPTLDIITGFEYGLATPSSNGSGLFSVVSGSPTIQNSIKRSGDYALRTNSNTQCQVEWTISGTVLVGVFYVRFAAWPTANIDILSTGVNSGVDPELKLDYLTHKLYTKYSGGSDDGPRSQTLYLDTWYRVDFKFDVHTNPYTIDFQVDGTAASQLTSSTAATAFTRMMIGPSEDTTFDIYWDDCAFSYTAGDYPIGPVVVYGLRPNQDGTHNNAANIMEDSAGNDIDGSTYFAFDKLDEKPWITTANADYVRQTANGTSNYCEIQFEDVPAGGTVLGTRAILQYASASATGNNGGCIIRDSNNQETTLWGAPGALADYSENTAYFKSVIVSVPSGGWTVNHVNALRCRFGYSGDANPDPYWLAIMLEVVLGPNTVSESVTLTRSVGVATEDLVTDSGLEMTRQAGISTAPESTIIRVTHEIGDLTEYSATTGDGLSVTADAALEGTTRGLNVSIDDTTADYGTITIVASTSGKVRARFYMDPNSLTMVNGDLFNIFTLRNSSGSIIGRVQLGYTSTGPSYRIRASIANNSSIYSYTSYYNIIDGPHYVEVYYQRATAGNGSVQLWIDGADKETVNGISNDTQLADCDSALFGAWTFTGTPSGNLYLDELVVNDSGNPIGGEAIPIEESVSLTRNAGVGAADQASVYDSVSVAKYVGTSNTEQLVADESVSTTKGLGISSVEQLVVDETATLAKFVGISITEGISFYDAVTLTRNAGMSVDYLLSLFDAVSLARYLGITPSDQVSVQDAFMLSRIDTIAATTANEILESIDLARYLGITTSELLSVVASITLDRFDAVTTSSVHIAYDATTLAKFLGISSESQLSAQDVLTLAKFLVITILEEIQGGPINEAVSLARYGGVSLTGVATAYGDVTLALTLALSLVNGILIEAAASLSRVDAISLVDKLNVAQSVTLAKVLALSDAVLLRVTEQVALAASKGISATSIGTYGVQITLANRRTISVSGVSTYEEAVALAYNIALSVADIEFVNTIELVFHIHQSETITLHITQEKEMDLHITQKFESEVHV